MIHPNSYLKPLLMGILLYCGGFCFSQHQRFNFSFSSVPVTEAISEISKQTKINFLYNPSIFQDDFLISGQYTNLTVTEILDTILRHSSIGYKLYKKDIVLFRNNERVLNHHKVSNQSVREGIATRKRIIDSVTYSIITYDTLVTNETRIQHIPVYDSITVYDTINVIRKINAAKLVYQPNKKTFIAGLSMIQGMMRTHIDMPNIDDEVEKELKGCISEKSSNGLLFSFIYRNSPWQLESGLAITRNKYSFEYNEKNSGFITQIDTIDRYYTGITGYDTLWVYVTEERQIETIVEKKYTSLVSLYYISLPVLFGYSYTRRNITNEIKLGILAQFYCGSKGDYLVPNMNNELIVSNSRMAAPEFSMDIFGGLCIDYFLDNHLHLAFQPTITYGAFGYNNKKPDYAFKNLQAGFQLGLRYYF